MPDLKVLLERAAAAAAEHPSASDELAAVVKHADAARRHVWSKHYASPSERIILAEKLAISPADFQAAVAATERALAEELADDNQRRARVRTENPLYFKD